ncbi:PTS lactose transporter subunit IIC [Paracoccus sp. S-4012]|uniref:PTS sugar transporter subunit IIA n=1 Tax=Paracoccus sp. S-4012 TaxID=2665648 RepID=UPI0012B11458|nr:PTS sugar transporter subunit IIA [Paracoccus sp. S-4012]MRX51492.1 PTS lactose transporter subunit IIC [Paracoccus sp. S-4012]
MQIAEILPPAAVRSVAQVASKKRLFHEIAELAQTVYGLPAATTLDALQEREALGPTGVGQGVALPHARLHGVEKVQGLFIRLDRPLDFDAVDRQPVDLVFTLLAPSSGGVDHLKALALVSRTMRSAELRDTLRANTDPVALHALLASATTIKAA